MRLFIAIDFPDNFLDIPKSIQASLFDISVRAKLTSSFHLTLRFLGEVSDSQKEQIVEKLSGISFPSFTLCTSSLGVFPNNKYIRVVWLGLENSEELKILQKNIESSLSSFSFRKDFAFHPHITLARVSNVDNKSAFLDKMRGLSHRKACFEVDRFTLYESVLKPQGPEYKKLKEFSASQK
ncbi:RNA 2',3'-cyclic phosphodiesterase [Candidatus Woesearchaeota archaeon]|nr:RNA 2',3'-cyclic phosphodiesterase [Candidatus Woesearchaeota archaeon]